MTISEEQKQWLVVGESLYKVLAPKLREFVEKGIQDHYTTLDGKDLKYGNINNSVSTHGKNKKKYNYNINGAVDLAKLYR